jgi:UDP:flavonoid glycosyltransferase YjiC (YdhE family)
MENDFYLGLDPLVDTEGYLKFCQKYLTNENYLREYRKLEPFCVAANQNTVILARHGSNTAALLASEQYNIPVLSVVIAPSYLTQLMVDENVFGKLLTSNVNDLRSQLGLPPVQSWVSWICSPKRSIALWPEWFFDIDPGIPLNISAVGFPLWEKPNSDDIPDTLKDFLNGKEPPVLITGGTSKSVSKAFYEVSAEACAISGQKALLVTQHEDLVPQRLPENVKWFGFLNLGEVFQYCKAVIHHGGIGTLSEALKAGVPQLALAYKVDRPFNGSLIEKLQVGEFFPLVKWRPGLIAEALNRITTSEIIGKNCRKFASKIKENNITANISKILEETIGINKGVSTSGTGKIGSIR